MADYLRTLAARAIGELPVVRPRQPSRFEPAISAEVRPDDALARDEWVAAAAPAWDDPVTRREPVPPSARPAASTTPMAPDGVRHSLEAARAARLPATPLPRIAEPPRTSAIVATAAEAEPEAARHDTPRPLERMQTARPVAVRQQEAPPSDVPHSSLTSRPRVPVPREAAAPIGETAHVWRGAVGPLADGLSIEAGSPRAAQPRREGDAETGGRRVTIVPQDVGERSATPNDGAPTISVNIGRIEVRASRPEPARTSVRAPRPQPRLTLDAFLSRQGRGR